MSSPKRLSQVAITAPSQSRAVNTLTTVETPFDLLALCPWESLGKAEQFPRLRKFQDMCTIASELYTVNILLFISTGRAKRGWTSQYKVVRSKPTYP